MVDQDITNYFNHIYDRTFKNTIRYITTKCSNIDDINEISQEVYAEVYLVLKRKGIKYIQNPDAFVAKVAKSKVYKHYSLFEKIKGFTVSNTELDIEDVELASLDTYSIEDAVIDKQMTRVVFEHLSKKADDVKRIFYLFYYVGLKIDEIALELNMSESNVKNKLYRTLKELRKYYGKDEG